MNSNPQIRFDVISPVTSDQDGMRNPRCISCLARALDFKDCPFYNVCPSCGSGPDTHGEHCPFKTCGPGGLSDFFRLHPLEPRKNPWWKSLNIWAPSLKSFAPDPTGPDPLRMLLHPYLDFPPRMALPMEGVAIRTAWDNECREYGITDPPNPPVYIRSIPSAPAFRKRAAESQAVVSEWQTTHSKRFRSTRNARSDGGPPGSLHSHSMLNHQGIPRSSTNRDPLELRSVPMSLVAPGMRPGVQRPLNSDMVRISW
ncbi:uncharacterized protein BP5553_03510 [Venustampulla echinocandica]|uniref:Uncharacterized protein n=1 Tax=Venustampulla echinocandica TaxID=2656787 RepID=A0A370TUJ0_9HELO|nr:uncharacterized protein BP5553_03510 [Venustampulla echinocandica]RDL39170.1 hypothetical protein BP5553_03510 [Venustampulla echinocandica]